MMTRQTRIHANRRWGLLLVLVILLGVACAVYTCFGPMVLATVSLGVLALGILAAQVWLIWALWTLRVRLATLHQTLRALPHTLPQTFARIEAALNKVSDGLESVEGLWKSLSRLGGWRGAILRAVWKRFTAAVPPAAAS